MVIVPTDNWKHTTGNSEDCLDAELLQAAEEVLSDENLGHGVLQAKWRLRRCASSLVEERAEFPELGVQITYLFMAFVLLVLHAASTIRRSA